MMYLRMSYSLCCKQSLLRIRSHNLPNIACFLFTLFVSKIRKLHTWRYSGALTSLSNYHSRLKLAYSWTICRVFSNLCSLKHLHSLLRQHNLITFNYGSNLIIIIVWQVIYIFELKGWWKVHQNILRFRQRLGNLLLYILLWSAICILSQIFFAYGKAEVWSLSALIFIEKLRVLNSWIGWLIRVAYWGLNAKLFKFHLISTFFVLKCQLSSFCIQFSWLLSFRASRVTLTRCCICFIILGISTCRPCIRTCIPFEFQLTSWGLLLPCLPLKLLIKGPWVVFIIESLLIAVWLLAHDVFEAFSDIKPDCFWTRWFIGRCPMIGNSLSLIWICVRCSTTDVVNSWIGTFQRITCYPILGTLIFFKILVEASMLLHNL